MTFDDIPAGSAVILDANILIYHFTNHPKCGVACTRLIERIEQGDLQGFVSTHILADVSHRLMTIEAMIRLGWPATGIAARLRKHHAEIPNLVLFAKAMTQIPKLGIQVLPVTETLVLNATVLSQQHELMTGDALIVAVMLHHDLANLASTDSDFDRVPGLVRYAAA